MSMRAICRDCGEHWGRIPKAPHVSTWWIAACNWCGKETDVTDPRDYGYPRLNTDDDDAFALAGDSIDD